MTAYAGLRLSDTWPSQTGCLYGLMTASGEAVTPPVFSSVSVLTWRSWFSAESRTLAPLVLRQGSGERGEQGVLQNAYTLAARDLSWVYPGSWRQVIPGPGYLLLLGEDHMEQVSEDGALLKSWDYAAWGLTEYIPNLLDAAFFDSIQGYVVGQDHVVGDLLGLEAVDWSDYESGFYLFDLNSGESVTRTWEELQEEFAPEVYVGYKWTVEETETGCRFTRGEETMELPVPAASDYAYLWGDLVIFPNAEQVFHRDGREILPTDTGKPRGIGALGNRMGQMEKGDLLYLTLFRYEEENTMTTFFIRYDGSVLDLTLKKALFTEDQSTASADGNILGIVERDKACYYRIDTEECVFRIPLYYEKD